MTTSYPVVAAPASDPLCCTSATTGLGAEQAAHVARTFRALGEPARVRLFSIIASAPDGEACICDLTEPLGLSQPTVSHHMKLLAEAGLVTREQRGRWAYYSVAAGSRERLDASIDAVLTSR